MRSTLWVAKTQFRAAHILPKLHLQLQSDCGIALSRRQAGIELGGLVGCHPTLLWLGSRKSENLRFWLQGQEKSLVASKNPANFADVKMHHIFIDFFPCPVDFAALGGRKSKKPKIDGGFPAFRCSRSKSVLS